MSSVNPTLFVLLLETAIVAAVAGIGLLAFNLKIWWARRQAISRLVLKLRDSGENHHSELTQRFSSVGAMKNDDARAAASSLIQQENAIYKLVIESLLTGNYAKLLELDKTVEDIVSPLAARLAQSGTQGSSSGTELGEITSLVRQLMGDNEQVRKELRALRESLATRAPVVEPSTTKAPAATPADPVSTIVPPADDLVAAELDLELSDAVPDSAEPITEVVDLLAEDLATPGPAAADTTLAAESEIAEMPENWLSDAVADDAPDTVTDRLDANNLADSAIDISGVNETSDGDINTLAPAEADLEPSQTSVDTPPQPPVDPAQALDEILADTTSQTTAPPAELADLDPEAFLDSLLENVANESRAVIGSTPAPNISSGKSPTSGKNAAASGGKKSMQAEAKSPGAVKPSPTGKTNEASAAASGENPASKAEIDDKSDAKPNMDALAAELNELLS